MWPSQWSLKWHFGNAFAPMRLKCKFFSTETGLVLEAFIASKLAVGEPCENPCFSPISPLNVMSVKIQHLHTYFTRFPDFSWWSLFSFDPLRWFINAHRFRDIGFSCSKEKALNPRLAGWWSTDRWGQIVECWRSSNYPKMRFSLPDEDAISISCQGRKPPPAAPMATDNLFAPERQPDEGASILHTRKT